MNQTYRLSKLDDSEDLPYEFIFKTDAIKLMDHLNKLIGNTNESLWYVRSNNLSVK